jgi:membrane-bound lytic murein transglycosylase D
MLDTSTICVVACFGLLMIPAQAAGADWGPEQGPGNVRSTADPLSFQRLLQAQELEAAFERSHPGFDGLWAPGAVYVPRREVPHKGISDSLSVAIEEVFAESKGTFTRPFGLDVQTQAPVVAFVDFWTGRGRATLARYLAKMGRYEALIREILREEGVPEDLIYLCLVESGFTPRALSRANAGGLWQFIPATAVNYGLRIDDQVDERRDPVKATRAAARYLRSLHESLGSWPLAMAGYNAGSGNVESAIRRANSSSYWLLAQRDTLPRNTRNYVAKILAVALIAGNRPAFRFEGIRPEPPMTFDTVEVPGGVALSTLAEAIDTDVAELKALNPELIVPRTPSRVRRYAVRIPHGTGRRFADAFDRLAATTSGTVVYSTRVGETLLRVADRLGVPPQVLRAANGLDDDFRVPYGTQLLIPSDVLGRYSPELVPASGESLNDKLASVRPPTRAQGATVVMLPSVRFAYPDRRRVFYETQEGDTTSELAGAFGVHETSLSLWNGLEGERLHPGLTLQIYVGEHADLSYALVQEEGEVRCVYDGTEEYEIEYGKKLKRQWAGTARGGGRSHRVKPGESLRSIARQYGVTARDLAGWNNLGGKRLKPGYRLVVYGSKETVATQRGAAAQARPPRGKSKPKSSTAGGASVQPTQPQRSSGVRYQVR